MEGEYIFDSETEKKIESIKTIKIQKEIKGEFQKTKSVSKAPTSYYFQDRVKPKLVKKEQEKSSNVPPTSLKEKHVKKRQAKTIQRPIDHKEKLPKENLNASKPNSKFSNKPKVSKSSPVWLNKDTSNGATRFRDRYGWFSHDKPKKQEVFSFPKETKKLKKFQTPRSNSLNTNVTGGKTEWVRKSLEPKIESVEKKKKRRRKNRGLRKKSSVSVSLNNESHLNNVNKSKAKPCGDVNNVNVRACGVAKKHVTFNSYVNVRTFNTNVLVDDVLVSAYVDSKACLYAFPKLYPLPVLTNHKGPVFKWVPKVG